MPSRITATIVADSVSPLGVRLATLQLKYPRFVHAELMTHRVFSRNAASSRAIPVTKMMAQVWNDPATFVEWGKNQPGMQARAELQGLRRWAMQKLWRVAGKVAVCFAYVGHKLGAHKQIVNRMLEPWQWMETIVTATEWENFFHLRIHPDAQPEIRCLADRIKAAMDGSMPRELRYGDWHLPYVEWDWTACSPGKIRSRQMFQQVVEQGWHPISLLQAIKASVARCARVSFLNHDKTYPVLSKDVDLHDKLVAGDPMHASPAEHQATPYGGDFDTLTGNLRGWVQYRKLLEHPVSAPYYIPELQTEKEAA
jgi:muconolactone delta-isomerase